MRMRMRADVRMSRRLAGVSRWWAQLGATFEVLSTYRAIAAATLLRWMRGRHGDAVRGQGQDGWMTGRPSSRWRNPRPGEPGTNERTDGWRVCVRGERGALSLPSVAGSLCIMATGDPSGGVPLFHCICNTASSRSPWGSCMRPARAGTALACQGLGPRPCRLTPGHQRSIKLAIKCDLTPHT